MGYPVSKTLKQYFINIKSSKTIFTTICLVTLNISLISSMALAQNADVVANFLQNGQFQEALNTISTQPNNNKDPLLRFQKGVALSGLMRNDEAITEFSSLIKEFPQLSEPYNNLAVLYSAKGDFIKAKTALESAIKIQPNYPTAYENLGDIYSKIAMQYYQKAVSLDTNSNAQNKMTNLKLVINPGSAMPMPIPAPLYNNRDNYNNTAPILVAPIAKGKHKNKNTSTNEVTFTDGTEKTRPKQKTIKLDKTPTAKIDKIEKPLPIVPTVKVIQPIDISKPSNNPEIDKSEISQVVKQWSSNWSNKNIDGYLAHYAESFSPNDGKNKEEWAKARKTRILDKNSIKISFEAMDINITSNSTARVNFKQIYESDKFKDTSNKTLEMIKVNGQWKIKREN